MIKANKNKEQVEITIKGTPHELISDLIAIGLSLVDAVDGSKEVTDKFESAFKFGIEEGLKEKGKEIYGTA
jgi:hypothetical protein